MTAIKGSIFVLLFSFLMSMALAQESNEPFKKANTVVITVPGEYHETLDMLKTFLFENDMMIEKEEIREQGALMKIFEFKFDVFYLNLNISVKPQGEVTKIFVSGNFNYESLGFGDLRQGIVYTKGKSRYDGKCFREVVRIFQGLEDTTMSYALK